MTRKPRGTCLIINNCEFKGNVPQRWGSEIDVDRMKRLFTDLHFRVEVYGDLTAQEMRTLLRNTAKDDTQHHSDCLVVIIMSHGWNGWIMGSDEQMIHTFGDVCEEFSNANCEALQGKPKVFFVQACQGDKVDKGHRAVMDEADATYSFRTAPYFAPQERTTTFSDVFVAEATIPDHVAQRNALNGSWFVKAIFDVFRKNAHNTHLVDLMEMVSEQVMSTTNINEVRQTPHYRLMGWRKKLYFRPGFFEQ